MCLSCVCDVSVVCVCVRCGVHCVFLVIQEPKYMVGLSEMNVYRMYTIVIPVLKGSIIFVYKW